MKFFAKYFHFPDSRNLKIFDFRFQNQGKYKITKNLKFSDFRNPENENILRKFSKLFKIKVDNIFFAYSRNITLHRAIQSPATNSARRRRYFDCSSFNSTRIALILDLEIRMRGNTAKKHKKNRKFQEKIENTSYT